MFWNVITDFGDSAAMLPLAAALLLWLLANGMIRAAALWVILFGAEALIVAATKIAFLGWGIGIGALDFTGISGHSTLASSILPIAGFLAARRAGAATRRVVTLGGFACGLLIGLSRIALAQHSWSEVVAGCLLGGLVAMLFVLLCDDARAPARLPAPVIVGVVACLMVVLHGTRAPSEYLITRIALHLSGHSMPYGRERPHHGWWRGTPDDISSISREPGVKVASAIVAYEQS